MITTKHTFIGAEKPLCESKVGYEIHKLKITQWSEVSEMSLHISGCIFTELWI